MIKDELLLKGSGLFVYSDPGGAKPVLTLALQLSSELNACRIVSDRTYPFQKSFHVEVSHPGESPENDLIGINADFLFTGSSYTSDIERRYLIRARELGIITYTFVDQAIHIKDRFQYQNEQVYPNYVLVPDNEVYDAAVSEGLPSSLLKVFPNPFYTYLKNWKPERCRDDVLREYKISPDERKLVICAPDPLSNIPDLVSRHGFYEVDALRQFMPCFRQVKNSCRVILVPHPNQNISLIKDFITSKDEKFISFIPSGCDVKELLYHADLVIGFFSNILLEAKILGTPVMRYVVNTESDLLKSRNIGDLVNNDNFLDVLKRHLVI